MGILQESLEDALHGASQTLVAERISQKLASQGVEVSARERERLVKWLKERGSDTFSFKRWSWRFWARKDITVAFSTLESDEFVGRVETLLLDALPSIVESTAEEICKKTLVDLDRRWPAESRRSRREMDGFRKRLHGRWKVPLERLKMLRTLSVEFGDVINTDLRKSSDPSRTFLVEVLTRSHARACHIAGEIIWLLEGGFADGAMARWRTLHETAVVAGFIAQCGEDLAERYLLHEKVESRKAADEYERCRERLGLEKLDGELVRHLEAECAAFETKFGKDFKEQYGWAAQHLNNRKPTFADIERGVGNDHLRPYYRLASHNVHANPKGVFFKLGLMYETGVLLAGPSNAGLAEPGHGAAISLAHVSASLSSLHTSLDTMVSLKVIIRMMDEIGEAFGAAQADLESDIGLANPAGGKITA